MFHKEGAKLIFIGLIVTVAIALLADHFIANGILRMIVQLIALAFLILILQFFRNPKRHVIATDHNIIAPVDGKVVVIE